MASNKRIYFANQMVGFKRDDVGEPVSGRPWMAAHGIQSVAVSTTFNLEQAFELGQLSIYENIEGVPDVEVTSTKVLDGYPLLYTFATNEFKGHGHSPSLVGRSTASCIMGLGVWPETSNSATGIMQNQMECSGLFASSVSYSFPTEDNFTEDITLVGNNKAWLSLSGGFRRDNYTQEWLGCDQFPWSGAAMVSGFFDDSPPTQNRSAGQGNPGMASGMFNNSDAPIGTGGVNRRENLAFAVSLDSAAGGGGDSDMKYGGSGYDFCRLPTDIPGVDSSGWMNPNNSAGNISHISSISISTDLGREDLFELGTRQPYHRPVTFPVEVTCDIEVISVSGDLVNAFADGCGDGEGCGGIVDNLTDQSIRIATCEGTRIYLGKKNKLASVNYGGGDAGGGNVNVSYSYTTFNDFTVMHVNDPNASGVNWWARRQAYLGYKQQDGDWRPIN